MAKPLVIVESPAKAKTIAGYLGSDYTVKASVGHIRDLPRSKEEVPDDKKATHGRLAGIDPDDHFDACYVVPANKKKVVAELKAALKGADELILATDEDREGEAIGWHVLEALNPRVPVKRMVFHEITPNAIREALAHPRDLDMKLVEAQEGRRKLDRIVGWETSPVLWRVFGRGQAASAGRVQSVAVRMVVERERARMRFRSGQWSDLEGTFVAEDAAVPRVARRARRQARRRRPRLRRRDRCDRARRASNDVVLLDAERARGLGRSPARRRVPRHEHRVRSVHREAARTVHHVDAATGVGPQAALHRGAHDGRRATALRARIHHLYANRQHEPVGAGRRRGAHRDPRAVRRGVPARASRARSAAR